MSARSTTPLTALAEAARASRGLLLALPRAMLFVLDRDLRCVLAEGEALGQGGLSPSTFEGRPFSDIVAVNTIEEVEAMLLAALEGRETSHTVCSPLTGRFYALRARPVEGPGGIEGLVVLGTDVTEQEAERARLAQRESRFAAFVENMNAAAFIKDAEGRYVFVNPAWERIRGVPRSTGLGSTDLDLSPPEVAERLRAADRLTIESGALVEATEMIPGSQGERHDFITAKFPIVEDEQTLVGGVAIEVSEQRRLERAAAESEERYRALVGAIDDAILLFDRSGTVVTRNLAAERLLGLTAPLALGRPATWELLDADLAPGDPLTALVHEATERRLPVSGALMGVRRPDGAVSWLAANAQPMLGSDGVVEGVVVSARDVTVERASTAERDRLLTRFRTLFEHLPVVAFEADADGRAMHVNPAWTRLTGMTEAESAGIGWLRAIHPDDRELVHHAWVSALVESRAGVPPEFRYLRADGSVAWGTAHAHPLKTTDGRVVGWVGTLTDISHRRADEEERRRRDEAGHERERLASLALLAGGVAHDLNNLLTVVMGSANMARDEAAPRTRGFLERIEIAARQAAGLSGVLMDYSGGGIVLPVTVDAAGLVRGMTPVLRGSVPAGISLDVGAAGPVYATGDPRRLQQIVLNLVGNAADAVDGHGLVRVTVEEREVDAEWLEEAHGGDLIEPGRVVALVVEDDGPGIAPEVVSRVFDPFFTTKETGRGLGLASVLGIARAHGGAVRAESDGHGTRFTVLLPAAEAPAEATPAAEPADAPDPPVDRVLVVDDQVGVRLLIAETLRHRGVEVVTAETAEEALACARRPGLSVILLDLTMPDTTGPELLRRLRDEGLTTPVVLMSGFSEEHALGELGSLHADGFLQKPFRLEELLAVLGSVGH